MGEWVVYGPSLWGAYPHPYLSYLCGKGNLNSTLLKGSTDCQNRVGYACYRGHMGLKYLLSEK